MKPFFSKSKIIIIILILYIFYKNNIIFCNTDLILSNDYSTYIENLKQNLITNLKLRLEDENFQKTYLKYIFPLNLYVWFFFEINFVENFVDYLFKNNLIQFNENTEELYNNIFTYYIENINNMKKEFSYFVSFYFLSLITVCKYILIPFYYFVDISSTKLVMITLPTSFYEKILNIIFLLIFFIFDSFFWGIPINIENIPLLTSTREIIINGYFNAYQTFFPT